MNNLDRLLTTISQAPVTQITPAICAKVKRLVGCPKAIIVTEMKEILEEAKKDNNATEFALDIMNEVVIIAGMKDD